MWDNTLYKPENEIRTEKCSDMSAQNEVVITLIQTDQTLVEIYTVVLRFGWDTCHIKLEFIQVNM